MDLFLKNVYPELLARYNRKPDVDTPEHAILSPLDRRAQILRRYPELVKSSMLQWHTMTALDSVGNDKMEGKPVTAIDWENTAIAGIYDSLTTFDNWLDDQDFEFDDLPLSATEGVVSPIQYRLTGHLDALHRVKASAEQAFNQKKTASARATERAAAKAAMALLRSGLAPSPRPKAKRRSGLAPSPSTRKGAAKAKPARTTRAAAAAGSSLHTPMSRLQF